MSNQTTALVEQFVAKTLPKALWTHEAHLRVGLWHVLKHGAVDAMTLLRERIRAYNESVGTQNTETSGYHETITQFYVLMIGKFLTETDCPFSIDASSINESSIDELSTALLTAYGERELAMHYYSRELLFSVKARLHWMEPDKQPID